MPLKRLVTLVWIGAAIGAGVVLAQQPVTLYDTTSAPVVLAPDATHNSAVKPTGPQIMVAASTAAPTAATAGNAVRPWADLNGTIHIAPTASIATDGAALTCYLSSAASTNSTNCKTSGGNVYEFGAINTTAVVYFVRLYNLAAAPTCSSATGFVESIPVPASTSGAGVVRSFPVGRAYPTGIGFCITGGGSSTDNTNAATGLYLSIGYR